MLVNGVLIRKDKDQMGETQDLILVPQKHRRHVYEEAHLSPDTLDSRRSRPRLDGTSTGLECVNTITSYFYSMDQRAATNTS